MEGERYLRLLAEQLLDDARPVEMDSYSAWAVVQPLEAAGRALAAVGAVEPATAQEVTADLLLALAVRVPGNTQGLEAQGPMPYWMDEPSQLGPPVVREQRVIACPAPFRLDDRQVDLQFLVFGSDRAELTFAVTLDEEEGSGTWSGRGGLWTRTTGLSSRPSGPAPPGQTKPRTRPDLSLAELQITDDHGNRYQLGGGGAGGGLHRFDCRYELLPVPPEDVRWFEFTGPQDQHVRVTSEANPATVVTPGLQHGRSAGEQYLTAQVAGAVSQFSALAARPGGRVLGGLDAATEALIAVAVLDPHSSVVDQVGLVETALVTGTIPPGLDEPFASVIRAVGRTDGRQGVVAVGGGVVVDGIAVAMEAVVCDPDSFSLHTFVSPWSFGRRDFDAEPVGLSAEDDLGGRYLGAINGSSGGSDGAAVRTHFVPAIDPAARRLRIDVTGRTEQASVEVALP